MFLVLLNVNFFKLVISKGRFTYKNKYKKATQGTIVYVRRSISKIYIAACLLNKGDDATGDDF